MKKSIEEAIYYTMDGLEFTEDWNLEYFDSWVNNKVQNEFSFSSNWLRMFSSPQSGWRCNLLSDKNMGYVCMVETPYQKIFKDNQQSNSLE